MERFKSKKVWFLIIGVFVLLVVTFYIGYSSATATIDEEKLNFDEVVEKISDAEKELEDQNAKMKDVKSQIESEEKKLGEKKDELEEALTLIEKQGSLANDIEKLESEIKEKQSTIDGLTDDISAKEKEVDSLAGTIKKKKEAPIELGAGQYTVGNDIPEGRYKATNVGRGSNFVVENSSGRLKVNTILGDGIGSGDYVFSATSGDALRTEATVKLIPVEE